MSAGQAIRTVFQLTLRVVRRAGARAIQGSRVVDEFNTIWSSHGLRFVPVSGQAAAARSPGFYRTHGTLEQWRRGASTASPPIPEGPFVLQGDRWLPTRVSTSTGRVLGQEAVTEQLGEIAVWELQYQGAATRVFLRSSQGFDDVVIHAPHLVSDYAPGFTSLDYLELLTRVHDHFRDAGRITSTVVEEASGLAAVPGL